METEWQVGCGNTSHHTRWKGAVMIVCAEYNQWHNCIEIRNIDMRIIFRLNCNEWEDGLKTTSNSQGALGALAIDEPLEYARLMLNNEAQAWIDAQDDMSVW